MKPSWDSAPTWAEWLAMDADGWWHWYEYKPEWDGEQWLELSNGLVMSADDPEPWNTLEARP